MMKRSLARLPLLALLLLGTSVYAQTSSASLMRVTAETLPATAAAGGHFTLKIHASLQKGWHCNAHKPSEDYLIPTEVKLSPAAGITIGEFTYPPAEQKKFSFSEKPLAVYEGNFDITAEGTVADHAIPGTIQITGTLHFQPCNDSQCQAPASVPWETTLRVLKGAAAAGATSSGTSASGSAAGNPFGRPGRGILGTLLLLFAGGLALNLTPCVYPVIPITISFFGGQREGRSGRPVGLAAVYVLGMATMYSALGVFAALSGELFGSALQSPWVLGAIALIMVALALSMFGLYEINPPRFLMNRGGARKGLGGAFGMGLLVGVVAAPCLGPFVLGLLTYVASRHDPVLGFAMFFVLSLGLGLPYLFLAAFSGGLSRMPRAGAWMVEIKKVFGFVLLAMAAYFGRFLFHGLVREWILTAILAVGGAWILVSILRSRVPALARGLVAAGGVLLLGAAAFFAPRGEFNKQGLSFEPYTPSAIANTATPAMIDFSADWCIPCHELDAKTFSDPHVRRELTKLRLFRADMTNQSSPQTLALAKEFNIQGMPTIVFLDRSGKEIPGTRLVGFEGPAEFLKQLEKL